MLWLPIVLVVGTLACVYGAYLHFVFIRKRDPGISFFMLTACITYVLGVAAGWLFTTFDTPTTVDWWHMLALRVGMIGVGSVLISVSSILTARENGRLGRNVWLMIGGFWIIALLCARTSALDLAEGPISVRLVDFDVENVRGAARGGAKIFSTLKARFPDGSVKEVPSAGWEATTAEDAIEGCDPSSPIDVVLLEHMERVLAAECKR